MQIEIMTSNTFLVEYELWLREITHQLEGDIVVYCRYVDRYGTMLNVESIQTVGNYKILSKN